MRELDFDALATRLSNAGIALRHVHRTVNEVRDHYDDLVDAAVDDGASSRKARRLATQQLGSMDDLVANMASRRELKTWAFRYPRTAIVLYPVACMALLPALPVLAGVAHASSVMRWATSLLVAGFFTAFTLLLMQLSILLG